MKIQYYCTSTIIISSWILISQIEIADFRPKIEEFSYFSTYRSSLEKDMQVLLFFMIFKCGYN